MRPLCPKATAPQHFSYPHSPACPLLDETAKTSPNRLARIIVFFMPENLRCLEGIEYKPTSTALRLKVYVAGLHRKKGALVERPLADFAI